MALFSIQARRAPPVSDQQLQFPEPTPTQFKHWNLGQSSPNEPANWPHSTSVDRLRAVCLVIGTSVCSERNPQATAAATRSQRRQFHTSRSGHHEHFPCEHLAVRISLTPGTLHAAQLTNIYAYPPYPSCTITALRSDHFRNRTSLDLTNSATPFKFRMSRRTLSVTDPSTASRSLNTNSSYSRKPCASHITSW